MRIMAIDYGDQRIGLAVSDLLGMLCGEAWTMQEWNMERAASRICGEAKARGVEHLVLGLPRNMDGTEGQQAIDTRAFGDALRERVGLPIRYVDERLTSMSAHSMLHEGGLKRKDHKKVVDKVAAVLILQTYMQNPARSQE